MLRRKNWVRPHCISDSLCKFWIALLTNARKIRLGAAYLQLSTRPDIHYRYAQLFFISNLSGFSHLGVASVSLFCKGPSCQGVCVASICEQQSKELITLLVICQGFTFKIRSDILGRVSLRIQTAQLGLPHNGHRQWPTDVD